MDVSTIDWSLVGFIVMGVVTLCFLVFAARRQWSYTALLVGLLHLPIAFTNAAAPFRGALDPGYVGYALGLVKASAGVEVAIFASAILLGALVSACVAVTNRPGAHNYFVVAFDALFLLLLVPTTLSGAITRGLDSFRVEFGEYLQFAGLPALLFESGLLLLPPILGVIWGLWRARG